MKRGAIPRRGAGTATFAVAIACGAAACGDPSGEAPAATGAATATAPASAAPAPLAVDPKDPSSCAPCHAAIVTEWRESLHARAHHEQDPVYAALRAMRTEKQGAHIPAQCGACHNPADLADPGSPAAKVGVGCATCHQLDGVDLTGGKKGVHALAGGPEGRFRGPHDVGPGTSPAHQSGPALPELADGKTLCLACHGEEQNAAGLTTCATGVEHAATKEAKPCTSCHMEELPGPSGAVSSRPTHRSHTFRGPHLAMRQGSPGILAEAATLRGRFEGGAAGDRVLVTIQNESGHAFPTGFPGRTAVVVLRALDAAGQELARNVSGDPMKDHPEAVLNQGFAGEDGKPALAAFATKRVRDNRLRPGEARELVWRVPEGTTAVEAHLRFLLVPAPMAKAIGHDGPEARPIDLPAVVLRR